MDYQGHNWFTPHLVSRSFMFYVDYVYVIYSKRPSSPFPLLPYVDYWYFISMLRVPSLRWMNVGLTLRVLESRCIPAVVRLAGRVVLCVVYLRRQLSDSSIIVFKEFTQVSGRCGKEAGLIFFLKWMSCSLFAAIDSVTDLPAPHYKDTGCSWPWAFYILTSHFINDLDATRKRRLYSILNKIPAISLPRETLGVIP